jgi:predicted nucleotidyltransferase
MASSEILQQITPETIEYVCKTIVEAIDPIKIILFGSYAEGWADKESDPYLFVIHDLPESSRKVRRQIDHLFLHRRFGLDLIVRNPQQVEVNVADNNPFYTVHLFKKRVVLYDRERQKT